MKDRDRRKLYAVLTLLASIVVAIGTTLSITFVALGVLIVYIKNNFWEWYEKKKLKDETKDDDEPKKGLMQKLKDKFKKDAPDNEEIIDEEKCPRNYMKYDSSEFGVASQYGSNGFYKGNADIFTTNTSGMSSMKIPEYPSCNDRNSSYDGNMDTIYIETKKNKKRRKKKIEL